MYDFLLMNNSKYGLILHRFGDTAKYVSDSACHGRLSLRVVSYASSDQ